MSKKYPGGIIRGTPVVPSGPFENSTAPGIWTVDQATNYIRQGIWPTAGNVSPDAFIENLFSCFLYTGNGSTQTINNGIDLAGKGGLVWIKCRSDATSHALYDTERGAGRILTTNTTNAQTTSGSGRGLSSFNSTGFSLDDDSFSARTNQGGSTYVSWTFREQPKFFDCVTYTGTGASNTISHNLASTPGCIIFKRTDSTGSWFVYHNFDPSGYLLLNQTVAFQAGPAIVTSASSTTFTLPATANNDSGATYVAYLFAHNAGGFGLTGTDNVISCGSAVLDGSGNATVNLGYEPQWILAKQTSATSAWQITDTMRGMPVTGFTSFLTANTAAAEDITGSTTFPTATGFKLSGASFSADATVIYIAIRRGPMKVPTTGTSVFTPLATPATTEGNVGFPADLAIAKFPTGSQAWLWADRLRDAVLYSSSTAAENSIFGTSGPRPFDTQNGVKLTGIAATDYDFWMMRRAPGFFDEVCYTGTGSLPGVTHNLGVTPELKIIKRRNFATDWVVGGSIIGENGYVFLNTTAAFTSSSNYWDGGDDSATVFSVRNTNSMSDASGGTYVAYLFASAPGVSKVGSYTGTGTTQVINCGFTAGSRFIMIKRTDSTGDWYVWDSARGIVAGNDPYLLLNSTAAEVTNTDFVDTAATGFEISSTAPAAINASGGTFIFLAIA